MKIPIDFMNVKDYCQNIRARLSNIKKQFTPARGKFLLVVRNTWIYMDVGRVKFVAPV